MKRLTLLCITTVLLTACAHGGNGSGFVPSGANAAPMSANFAAPVDDGGPMRFAVALPLRNEADLDRFIADVSNPDSPHYQQFLTDQQFLERYAPSRSDLEAVANELRGAGFSDVTVTDQAVEASGSREQAMRYFGMGLASGHPAMPEALASRGALAVGLSALSPIHVDSELVPLSPRRGVRPHNFASPVGPYYTSDLKEAYQYPSYTVASGKGATIGVIIPSKVSIKDIKMYFADQAIGVSPSVTNVAVDGGGKYDPNSSNTGEATLDVEQSLGMAPNAKAYVFGFPNFTSTKAGLWIYDAYVAAVKAHIDVVNSSFGLCEAANPSSAYTAYEDVFKQGLAAGTTFVASSGDYANANCQTGSGSFVVGVDWPASSPSVLAVGGSNLKTQNVANTYDSAYVSEEAFEDKLTGGGHWGSGGGWSSYYARPSWQNGFNTKSKRGVPDVSGHMGGCPVGAVTPCNPNDSADVLDMAGKRSGIIGTSASSPDTVGLLALRAGMSGKGLGDVHPMFYAAKAQAFFHKGVKGNNGYPTSSGRWDPVLGIGTPLSAYKFVGAGAAAGVPHTSTNP